MKKVRNKGLARLAAFVLSYLLLIFAVKRTGLFTDIDLSANYIPKEDFSVYFTVNQKGVKYNLEWWQNRKATDKNYYVSLPQGVKIEDTELNFTNEKEILIDGKSYKNGDKLPPQDKYVITSGNEKYTLVPVELSHIPVMHIVTEDGGLELKNKDLRQKGNMVLLDGSNVITSNELEYIKGRGNYSWMHSKKSFALATKGKVDLLGMGSSDKWVLLSIPQDYSMLKDKIVYSLAQVVDLQYTTQCNYVNLFINGSFWGVYLLSEKVEVDPVRVNITNLEKINREENLTDFADIVQMGEYEPGAESIYGSQKWVDMAHRPEGVTGGYLLELQSYDRYGKSPSGFVTDYGQNVLMRCPEHASESQIKYISDYYQQFEDALLNPDGINDRGKHYSEYIDMLSFAKIYLLQELIQNYDAGITSTFFYKDVNGLMYAGPVWDFDYSGGISDKVSYSRTQDASVALREIFIEDSSRDKGTVFALLWRHEDFRNLCRDVWQQYYAPHTADIRDGIELLYNKINKSATADKKRWVSETKDMTMEKTTGFYRDYVDNLQFFFENRLVFMEKHLGIQ